MTKLRRADGSPTPDPGHPPMTIRALMYVVLVVAIFLAIELAIWNQ